MLLIACANVANLLLARYSARGYEFSVRTAIGASRGQLVRQLLAENMILSGLGAIGGIVFAAWSIRPMLALVPAAAGLPFADQVRVSPEALAFALGLSLLSSILFGPPSPPGRVPEPRSIWRTQALPAPADPALAQHSDAGEIDCRSFFPRQDCWFRRFYIFQAIPV
jgi:predicted lysophospholipase L1 biosynthesis ABC-type transport system permease subunit